MLVVAMACVVLSGPATRAPGQTRLADGSVAGGSTLELGQLVLREDFSDGVTGSMWRTFATCTPADCRVEEVNGRLELRADGEGWDCWGGYVASGWRLDPKADFAVKADFYYDLITFPKGSVDIGITPDSSDIFNRSVNIGVGCSNKYSFYWYRETDGYGIDSSSTQRFDFGGTLYLSYDASLDELYVGISGYGPDNAWTTFEGLLNDRWGGAPVYLWIGGNSRELPIGSGHAVLDNVLVESGLLVESKSVPVYRFWSEVFDQHFYTISEEEKEKILTNYMDDWAYEGVVYHAWPDDTDPESRPVHRFWSDELLGHFYTISEGEKDAVIKNFPTVWAYEGVAFYAYPEGSQPTWSRPVYRFWSQSKGAHFYTIDENERDTLVNQFGDIWAFEGIAWYASE
jgi:hypothetical protein